MSDRLRKHANTLQLLLKNKSKVNNVVIENADRDLISCLCECAFNVLKGNVPLTRPQKRRLARHKQGLRALTASKTSSKSKRKVLQTGGFLPALLAPVLSFVGPLLSKIFG